MLSGLVGGTRTVSVDPALEQSSQGRVVHLRPLLGEDLLYHAEGPLWSSIGVWDGQQTLRQATEARRHCCTCRLVGRLANVLNEIRVQIILPTLHMAR